MKHLILSVLMICAVGISAQADLQLMASPPDEVTPDTYRFSDLKPGYLAGVPATEAILTGVWKMVAIATSSACAIISTDTSNANGIKNNDGTFIELEFLNVTKSNPPGSSENFTKVFSVKINNFGKDSFDQGPYAVSSVESQFAQWNSSNGELDKDSYFNLSCRMSASSKYLICASKLVILSNSHKYDPRAIACAADNDYSSIVVYIRK